MTGNQKIIIDFFGLTNVQTINRVGVVGVSNIGTPLEKIALNTITGTADIRINQYKGKTGTQNPSDPAADKSVLGTMVWDNLTIAKGSYVDSTYGNASYNEMRLDSVLMTLTQANNVVLTPIQGRDGEVIEYVSKMSFRINVKGGIFSNTPNKRPSSDIINLKLMLQSNNPLTVLPVKNTIIGGFLSEWDISQFVILDKTIPQMMGGYNYQLFEFNAIQDIPVILAQNQAIS